MPTSSDTSPRDPLRPRRRSRARPILALPPAALLALAPTACGPTGPSAPDVDLSKYAALAAEDARASEPPRVVVTPQGHTVAPPDAAEPEG